MSQDFNVKSKSIASGKYIRMSPRKVRRVLDQIRGRSYTDALMLLEFMPYRACKPTLQVLNSAVANSEHNFDLEKGKLIISEAFANQGPVLRRFRPRAQGQGYKIRKPTCHIVITVEENN
jgi:large subunit ribosomal protein L22